MLSGKRKFEHTVYTTSEHASFSLLFTRNLSFNTCIIEENVNFKHIFRGMLNKYTNKQD